MVNYVYIYALEYPLGNIRYIGKAKNPYRRFNRHINDARKYTSSHKLAWIHSLLMEEKLPHLYIIDKIPESEWEEWECRYIKEAKELGCDLTNSTPGGDGLHNPPMEVRKKISDTLKKYFEDHTVWNKGTKGLTKGYPKGKKRSEEDTLAISKRKRELFKERKPWNYGKHLSEEQKEKLRQARLGISSKPRVIIQFDLDGNFIAEFNTMREAMRVNDIGRKTLKKCLNGNHPHDGKYIWRYKDEYETIAVC